MENMVYSHGEGAGVQGCGLLPDVKDSFQTLHSTGFCKGVLGRGDEMQRNWV